MSTFAWARRMARVAMLTTVLAASGTGVALAADTTSDHSGVLSGKNVNVGSGHQPCHCAPHRGQSGSSGQSDTGHTIDSSTPRGYPPSGIHHHNHKTPCHSNSHGSGQPVSISTVHTPSGAGHSHKPCHSASHASHGSDQPVSISTVHTPSRAGHSHKPCHSASHANHSRHNSHSSGRPVSISTVHTPSGARHSHKPCHSASHGNAQPAGIGHTPRSSSHNNGNAQPAGIGHTPRSSSHNNGNAQPAGIGHTPRSSSHNSRLPCHCDQGTAGPAWAVRLTAVLTAVLAAATRPAAPPTTRTHR